MKELTFDDVNWSNHGFVFIMTTFLVGAFVGMVYGLEFSGGTVPNSKTLISSFYVGVGVWWIFALISGIRPEYTRYNKDDPKYVKWLLVLPVSVIIMNCFLPFDSNDERMMWFNSLAVTWVGMVSWICVDWYRWKYNPNARHLRILNRRLAYAIRRAEIDKVPDCVIPSGLSYIPQD